MPIESPFDPRDALVKTKYFNQYPKPLERWLWKQALPQSAERVFWLHWQAEGRSTAIGAREIPIQWLPASAASILPPSPARISCSRPRGPFAVRIRARTSESLLPGHRHYRSEVAARISLRALPKPESAWQDAHSGCRRQPCPCAGTANSRGGAAQGPGLRRRAAPGRSAQPRPNAGALGEGVGGRKRQVLCGFTRSIDGHGV